MESPDQVAQGAQTMIRSMIGEGILDAFSQGASGGIAIRGGADKHSQGVLLFREAARRYMHALVQMAQSARGRAVLHGGSALNDASSAAAHGQRSMYELTQGAQGFREEAITVQQPPRATILDIVNDTRLPHFRFMDLPPELRLIVYDFYFVDPHPPRIAPYTEYDPLAPSFSHSITLVSKLVRLECRLQFRRAQRALWPADLTHLTLNFPAHIRADREQLRIPLRRLRDMSALQIPRSALTAQRYLVTLEMRMTLRPGVTMPIVFAAHPPRGVYWVRRNEDRHMHFIRDRTCGRMRFMCHACLARAVAYCVWTTSVRYLMLRHSGLHLRACAVLAYNVEKTDWAAFRGNGHGFPLDLAKQTEGYRVHVQMMVEFERRRRARTSNER